MHQSHWGAGQPRTTTPNHQPTANPPVAIVPPVAILQPDQPASNNQHRLTQLDCGTEQASTTTSRKKVETTTSCCYLADIVVGLEYPLQGAKDISVHNFMGSGQLSIYVIPVEKIITNRNLCKDIRRLSSDYLISYLEKLGVSGNKASLALRAYDHLVKLKTGFRAGPVTVSTTECDVRTLEQETRASIWSTDMRQLPLFKFAALYAYFITLTKKFKHIELASTSYKKLKAFQYFAADNVKSIQVARKHGTTYVKAKVLPSMKTTKYCTIIAFSNGQVTKAACDCPAG
ncbi:hypothetical protein Bbelb_049150 [Branchiostoma belcheri]|nr:hypothetical protein Bbelb_049150 [Branchiostoma belcheri]